MDEEALAREQARLLCRAIDQADLGLSEVWFHYFSIGGNAGQLEVEAYLHHALPLPALERDILAHAVNELIDHRPVLYAPYTCDLTDPQDTGDIGASGRPGGHESADGEDQDGTDAP